MTVAAKGFDDLYVVTELTDDFPWLGKFTKTARTNKSCGQQSKKCIFIESLREDVSRCINPSLKLTHVVAGFTKGTHHLLYLHTKYFLI